MAGYPPPGMHWGVMHGAHAAALQQQQQQALHRPAGGLPIEALGLMVGSRIEVRTRGQGRRRRRTGC